MNKGELIYLAVPYSHKNPSIKEKRFQIVNEMAALLMSKGYYIFSPISHTHPIATSNAHNQLPGEWEYWEGYDRVMMKCCKSLLVLKLEGWETSTGVQAEIKIANEFGIPIEYMEYADLT